MSDAHCPECEVACPGGVYGQVCPNCFWRLKNEERDRVMGEAAAKAAKEEAMKINLKRDIQASLDKIKALTAENARLRGQRDELASQIDAMEKRTTAVYDGCSGLTEENEELREEVRRLTEVLLGLAAIVVGKG